ncbi:MAG: hypothetical protein XD87_0062 [candidate division WS6 bacterium 36_33]|uniref:Uncharacterized protein n=1 Tax=candidate division WS6 bacterium 36_33 TaxID=1641388 RepID=A0A117LU16_9BACT|nr:MAG: hypothetical protein XD87_0062 [candidate division WS6 bacterium 36_33]
MVKEKYLEVKVKTRSQKDWVEYKNGIYIIHTKEPARDNKANFAAIELLSNHLDIPKRNISIKHGLKSKTKTICIMDRIEK